MKYISPYDHKEQKLESPDCKYVAEIRNVREFQMGGPMYGDLYLSNGVSAKGVGVSIKWSDDSRYLAVPELNAKQPEFKVLIINVGSGNKMYASGTYGPIGIKDFLKEKLILVNIDDTEIEIDVSKIKW